MILLSVTWPKVATLTGLLLATMSHYIVGAEQHTKLEKDWTTTLRNRRDIDTMLKTLGRGIFDPSLLSIFGPLFMAGLVALPFLAPTAILPFANFMSHVRGRRDIEDALGPFVVQEIPQLLARLAAKDGHTQRADGSSDYAGHQREFNKKTQETLRKPNIRESDSGGTIYRQYSKKNP